MRLLFAISFVVSAVCAYGADVFYTIATVAGSSWVGDGGASISAILFQAEGIAADVNGNLYIADAGNHRVRKVTKGGVITTFAGTGFAVFQVTVILECGAVKFA